MPYQRASKTAPQSLSCLDISLRACWRCESPGLSSGTEDVELGRGECSVSIEPSLSFWLDSGSLFDELSILVVVSLVCYCWAADCV